MRGNRYLLDLLFLPLLLLRNLFTSLLDSVQLHSFTCKMHTHSLIRKFNVVVYSGGLFRICTSHSVCNQLLFWRGEKAWMYGVYRHQPRSVCFSLSALNHTVKSGIFLFIQPHLLIHVWDIKMHIKTAETDQDLKWNMSRICKTLNYTSAPPPCTFKLLISPALKHLLWLPLRRNLSQQALHL